MCLALVNSSYELFRDIIPRGVYNITDNIDIIFPELFKYKPDNLESIEDSWFDSRDKVSRIKILKQVIKDIENS